jgi:hypothetical protein
MYVEACRWLERMIELANETTEVASVTEGPVDDGALELRADASINLGLFASWQGECVRSCAHLETATVLVHERGNAGVLARTLNFLRVSQWLSANRDRSRTVPGESLRITLEPGDPAPVVVAQRNLGIVARWEAQYERVNAMLQKSVVQARRTPNRAFSLARASPISRGWPILHAPLAFPVETRGRETKQDLAPLTDSFIRARLKRFGDDWPSGTVREPSIPLRAAIHG